MAKRNRNIEAFSLSFLDCICCGFGAIILLLVLSKIYEPAILEKTEDDLNQLIAALQEQLFEIRGDTVQATREVGRVRLETSETKMRLQTLEKELSKIQGQFDLLDQNNPALNIDEGELRAARQRLTEEMMNLRPFRRAPDDAVGGIPVDSEYVIFVIDTSGSMQAKWTWAETKLAEVLNVYPRVKGLQIMNDNGSYMFQQYGGTWIQDTPQIRESITRRSASMSLAMNSREVPWRPSCARLTASMSRTRRVTGAYAFTPSASPITSPARRRRAHNDSQASCACCANATAVLSSLLPSGFANRCRLDLTGIQDQAGIIIPMRATSVLGR
jgi:hypothetical protein